MEADITTEQKREYTIGILSKHVSGKTLGQKYARIKIDTQY